MAVPSGHPHLSRQDVEYLSAVQQSLVRGAVAAGFLTLVLGWFFANRLSLKLRELTVAIHSMSQGQLRQEVPVRSRDEVGMLAQAFNRMSLELAQAHEELQRSHEEAKQQAILLKELSIRDELTGLYNRRHFDEQASHLFAQAVRYGQPLTLMIGDLDCFKKINDTFSHEVGDQVLGHIARILSDNTRQSDIVARYGGEEFVIAFPQTALPQALILCEKLRELIEYYPWAQIHSGLSVTMSMGLEDDASLPSVEKVVARADARLYEAKGAGRNRVRSGLASPDAMLQAR